MHKMGKKINNVIKGYQNFIYFTVNKISLQNPRKLLMEPRDSVRHILKATP